MKKILLVDFCLFKGHHETYFIKILETFTQLGYYVFAYSPDYSKLEEKIYSKKLKNCQIIQLKLNQSDKLFRHFLLQLDRLIQRFPFSTYIRPSSLCNLIATSRLISQTGEKIPVFFAHVDSVLPAVPVFIADKFMPDRWSGLYIAPSYQSSVHLGRAISLQRFFAEKTLSLASCKSLLVLHPIYQTFFQKTCPNLNCLYLPELCLNESSQKLDTPSDLVSLLKEKSSSRIIISILGALTRKKNLLLFLETATQLDSKQYFPVVVGQLYKHQYSSSELKRISDLVESLMPHAFIRLDYYIPDEREFDNLLSISDIIYLQYKDHPFSSNILIRSMMHQKPVIVNAGYLMEQTVKQYRWPTVAKDNIDDVVDAIDYCTHRCFIDEQYYLRFRSDYSENNFNCILQKSLESLNSIGTV